MGREASCRGLDSDTWRAILRSLLDAVDAIDLARDIAALESCKHEQLPWLCGKTLYRAELPRMRARLDTQWREWITLRFGGEVAERFFANSSKWNTCNGAQYRVQSSNGSQARY